MWQQSERTIEDAWGGGWVESGRLLLPGYAAKPPKPKYPIAVDLFCGAGGMTCGTIQAGFHVVAGLEWSVDAVITYMVNCGSHPIKIHYATPADEERLEKALDKQMKGKNGIVRAFTSGSGWIRNTPYPGVEHIFFGDARKFTGEQILDAIGKKRGEVDLVMGGPPCQGFSKAGKQNVMDPRNSLVFEFVRLVLEIFPATMIMEEVPDIVYMTTPEGLNVVDAICRILEDGNFGSFDALKKSLTHNTNARGAMRGSVRKHKGEEDDEEGELTEEPAQLSLF